MGPITYDCAHMHTHTHACTHAHARAHTRAHTHMHACMHAHRGTLQEGVFCDEVEKPLRLPKATELVLRYVTPRDHLE